MKMRTLVNQLKGKLICSWRGHKKGSYDVFVVDKPIVLTGNHKIIGGSDAIQMLEKNYGDCGYVETIIYCKRCGLSFKKGIGGTIVIHTGTFEGGK